MCDYLSETSVFLLFLSSNLLKLNDFQMVKKYHWLVRWLKQTLKLINDFPFLTTGLGFGE